MRPRPLQEWVRCRQIRKVSVAQQRCGLGRLILPRSFSRIVLTCPSLSKDAASAAATIEELESVFHVMCPSLSKDAASAAAGPGGGIWDAASVSVAQQRCGLGRMTTATGRSRIGWCPSLSKDAASAAFRAAVFVSVKTSVRRSAKMRPRPRRQPISAGDIRGCPSLSKDAASAAQLHPQVLTIAQCPSLSKDAASAARRK